MKRMIITYTRLKATQGLVNTVHFMVAMEKTTNAWYHKFHK